MPLPAAKAKRATAQPTRTPCEEANKEKSLSYARSVTTSTPVPAMDAACFAKVTDRLD